MGTTRSLFSNFTWDILGDPGEVRRVGSKGGMKVFKYEQKSSLRKHPFRRLAKEPLGTDSHRAISINSSGCRLLGGHKKCLVLLCPTSANTFSWVLFVSSYTTPIVSIMACLAHAPKTCTQSGNFQFDIKSPSHFKILSARKLKTLFQKYKLELKTGIHACTTKTSHGKGNSPFFSFYRDYSNSLTLSSANLRSRFFFFWRGENISPPPHPPSKKKIAWWQVSQMQANSSGAEFLSTMSKFTKRMNFVIACLRPLQNMTD